MGTDTDNTLETEDDSAPIDNPEPESIESVSGDDARPSAHVGASLGTRTLGLERYIQFVYGAIGVVLFLLFNKIVELVWRQYAEPTEFLVVLASLVLAVGVIMGLYKHPKINELSFEVGTELSKVTWPTRKETSSATVIVLVASLIAAVFLGALDFFWSALTDLIYTTKA